jgi:hypothetical protein
VCAVPGRGTGRYRFRAHTTSVQARHVHGTPRGRARRLRVRGTDDFRERESKHRVAIKHSSCLRGSFGGRVCGACTVRSAKSPRAPSLTPIRRNSRGSLSVYTANPSARGCVRPGFCTSRNVRPENEQFVYVPSSEPPTRISSDLHAREIRTSTHVRAPYRPRSLHRYRCPRRIRSRLNADCMRARSLPATVVFLRPLYRVQNAYELFARHPFFFFFFFLKKKYGFREHGVYAGRPFIISVKKHPDPVLGSSSK